MIDSGALLGPDPRVRRFEPVAQHRLAAQRAEAGLSLPERPEQFTLKG